jgi:hypothetical protein
MDYLDLINLSPRLIFVYVTSFVIRLYLIVIIVERVRLSQAMSLKKYSLTFTKSKSLCLLYSHSLQHRPLYLTIYMNLYFFNHIICYKNCLSFTDWKPCISDI